jgi:hypothetical protein
MVYTIQKTNTMTQFTYMAIKVADEDQFNQVAEKLRGQGYRADSEPRFGIWRDQKTHVITYDDGEFGLYKHEGSGSPTRYTYEQFMKL